VRDRRISGSGTSPTSSSSAASYELDLGDLVSAGLAKAAEELGGIIPPGRRPTRVLGGRPPPQSGPGSPAPERRGPRRRAHRPPRPPRLRDGSGRRPACTSGRLALHPPRQGECVMKSRALIYDAARALPVYPAIPGRLIILGLAPSRPWVRSWVPRSPRARSCSPCSSPCVTAWWFVREVVPAQSTKGTIAGRATGSSAPAASHPSGTSWSGRRPAMRRQRHHPPPVPRRGSPPSPAGVAVSFLLARNGLGWLPGQKLHVRMPRHHPPRRRPEARTRP
jgi:hypothetical protein